MWDRLKQTDIEQAKHQLEMRRAETLRKQALEIQSCDAGRTEAEILSYMVDAFVHKYPRPKISAAVAMVTEVLPKISAAVAMVTPTLPKISATVAMATPTQHKQPAKSAPEARHPQHREHHHPRTNFETFAHAVSRG